MFQHEIDGGDSIYNVTVTFCGLEPQVAVPEAYLGGRLIGWGNVMCITSADMGYDAWFDNWSASFEFLLSNIGTLDQTENITARVLYDGVELFAHQVRKRQLK